MQYLPKEGSAEKGFIKATPSVFGPANHGDKLGTWEAQYEILYRSEKLQQWHSYTWAYLGLCLGKRALISVHITSIAQCKQLSLQREN